MVEDCAALLQYFSETIIQASGLGHSLVDIGWVKPSGDSAEQIDRQMALVGEAVEAIASVTERNEVEGFSEQAQYLRLHYWDVRGTYEDYVSDTSRRWPEDRPGRIHSEAEMLRRNLIDLTDALVAMCACGAEGKTPPDSYDAVQRALHAGKAPLRADETRSKYGVCERLIGDGYFAYVGNKWFFESKLHGVDYAVDRAAYIFWGGEKDSLDPRHTETGVQLVRDVVGDLANYRSGKHAKAVAKHALDVALDSIISRLAECVCG